MMQGKGPHWTLTVSTLALDSPASKTRGPKNNQSIKQANNPPVYKLPRIVVYH